MFADPLIFNEAHRQQAMERRLKQHHTDIQRLWRRTTAHPDVIGQPQTGPAEPDPFVPPTYCQKSSSTSISTGASTSCSTVSVGSKSASTARVSTSSRSGSNSTSRQTTYVPVVSLYSCSTSVGNVPASTSRQFSLSQFSSQSCSTSTSTVSGSQNECGCNISNVVSLEITSSTNPTGVPLQTVTLTWDGSKWAGTYSTSSGPENVTLECTGVDLSNMQLIFSGNFTCTQNSNQCTPLELTYSGQAGVFGGFSNVDATVTGGSASTSCSTAQVYSKSYSTKNIPSSTSNSTSCKRSESKSYSHQDTTISSLSTSYTYSYSTSNSTAGYSTSKSCETSTASRAVVSFTQSCVTEDRPYP